MIHNSGSAYRDKITESLIRDKLCQSFARVTRVMYRTVRA
jgi:hypothetical protein